MSAIKTCIDFVWYRRVHGIYNNEKTGNKKSRMTCTGKMSNSGVVILKLALNAPLLRYLVRK